MQRGKTEEFGPVALVLTLFEESLLGLLFKDLFYRLPFSPPFLRSGRGKMEREIGRGRRNRREKLKREEGWKGGWEQGRGKYKREGEKVKGNLKGGTGSRKKQNRVGNGKGFKSQERVREGGGGRRKTQEQ